MDRLTFEGNFCDISRCQNTPGGSFCEDGACSQRKVWERLKEYEDAGLSPQACVEAMEIEAGLSAEDYSIHRMVELMRADKDGRLVVLPCKIGGTVYLLLQDDVKHNPETCGWYISEDRVGAIAEGGFYLGDPADDVYVRNEEIGEEVFLTREGAEEALRMAGNG